MSLCKLHPFLRCIYIMCISCDPLKLQQNRPQGWRILLSSSPFLTTGEWSVCTTANTTTE